MSEQPAKPRKRAKGAGRKPVPTALKKLRGTVEPAKQNKFEPMPEQDLSSEPPHWLTDDAQAAWRYAVAHAPRGLLKALDRDALADWCVAASRHRMACMMQAQLDQRSKYPLLMRAKGGLEISKYVVIQERSELIKAKLAQALGFTPASRPRISLIPAAALPPMIEGEAEPAWGVLGHLHGEAA